MTEETFIEFDCPGCGQPVCFRQEDAGSVQDCPNCDRNVIVPKTAGGAGEALPFPLTTPRLILRRLRMEDCGDLQALLADEELFVFQRGMASEEEEILRWLENDEHVKLTTPNQAFFLAVESQAHHKVIGYLTVALAHPQRVQAEVGAVIGRAHQRQGFATEALAVLLSFCLNGLSLHRVIAHCDSRDTAVRRLLEKVGFRREGEFVQDHRSGNEWASTTWYAILDQEYRQADGEAAREHAE